MQQVNASLPVDVLQREPVLELLVACGHLVALGRRDQIDVLDGVLHAEESRSARRLTSSGNFTNFQCRSM